MSSPLCRSKSTAHHNEGREYIYHLRYQHSVVFMKCLECNTDEPVVKNGVRNTQKGTIQRYYCKRCDTSFSDSKSPHTKYPGRVILYALEQYNRGYPIKTVKKRTGKKYQYSPPVQTIYSWVKRYQGTLAFLELRKKYSIDPDNLTTTHNFQHQQVYPFTYHHLKLNIHSKQRPELRRYINWIERSLPRKMFLSGPRCSSLEIDHDTNIEEKENITTELTRLALGSEPKNSKRSPHEIVQDFFLINDSSTVATELPVFINPKETSLDVDDPITGHIDLIQIRYKDLYILDYKPNLNNPDNYTSQLRLYKKAVQRRTSIPEDKIHTAVFNRHGYYEFQT